MKTFLLKSRCCAVVRRELHLLPTGISCLKDKKAKGSYIVPDMFERTLANSASFEWMKPFILKRGRKKNHNKNPTVLYTWMTTWRKKSIYQLIVQVALAYILPFGTQLIWHGLVLAVFQCCIASKLILRYGTRFNPPGPHICIISFCFTSLQ